MTVVIKASIPATNAQRGFWS